MEEAEAALGLRIGSRDRGLTGPITVTAPQLLVERVMAPMFATFRQDHGEIDLKVLASNDTLNLSRREADVAIRISDAPAESLVGSRAAEQRAAVFASHGYAQTLADTPERPLDWIRFLHWPGPPETVRRAWPDLRIALSVDDMVAAAGAVRAGIGATRMPCFLGDGDPELTRLPGIEPFSYPSVWVLTHADLKRIPRVRTFMQFITAHLKSQRSLFYG